MIIPEIIKHFGESPLEKHARIPEKYKNNPDAKAACVWVGSNLSLREKSQDPKLSEMYPFLYCSDSVYPYLIGVYLLRMFDDDRNDVGLGEATTHFFFFLGSDDFLQCFRSLSHCQMWLLFASVSVIDKKRWKERNERVEFYCEELHNRVVSNLDWVCRDFLYGSS